MEYRKLISFGKSSFVISLPKSWVKKNDLDKGSLLYLTESNNDLIISPKQKDIQEQPAKTINVDGKDITQVCREINASYINNYHKIELVGNQLEEKSKEILEYVRQLIALEVMEHNSEKILTRDFLDMNKTSITELIKKMDVIVRSMIKDCSKCFDSKDNSSIELRDKDVNRLSFLAHRTIRYGLRHQSLMLKQQDLRAVDLLNHYLLTSYLESVADEAKRISRAIAKISFKKKQREEFSIILKDLESDYLDAIKAFYDKDSSKAMNNSSRKIEMIKKVNECYKLFTENDQALYLIDRCRKMISSIHEIGKLTYQY